MPASSRATFERRRGLTVMDVTGTTPGGPTGLRPSPQRSEYYPFLYIAQGPSWDVLAGLPGLDVLGYPGQPAALAAARRSGQPTMVGLTPTPQGTMAALYAAVYERGETPGPRARVRGFVSASFMLDAVVEAVREGLPPGTRMQILEGGRSVYGPADLTSGVSVTGDVAGRTWTLRLDVPASNAGLATAAVILIGGMMITGGVGLLFAQGNRRERDSRRVASEQSALRRVATAAASTPEDVVSLVAMEAALLVGADIGLVCRFDDGRARTVGAWGEGESAAPLSLPLRGDGALARVARTGEPVRVDDYVNLPPDDPMAGSEWTRVVACTVATPVRVGATLWGAVLVGRHERRPWPADTEQRLGRLADLAAAAIASAEARRALALQATTDPLTGLANRRTFEGRLDAESARAERGGQPLALALLDIDHFKRVNDRFGHQAGDRVLLEVARRLSSIARPQDLVARIGGEEIAWLMADTDELGAYEAAERARRRIAGESFDGVGVVTVSVGVCDRDRAVRAGGLMRGADLALYWANGHGRDRTACCTGAGDAAPAPGLEARATPLPVTG